MPAWYGAGMSYVQQVHTGQVLAEDRVLAFRARAKRARRYARLASYMIGALFLMATWQDRALAPPVHDGMVMIADKVSYALENSENAREFVKQTFSSPSGTSVQAEFDPITAWLLKWR